MPWKEIRVEEQRLLVVQDREEGMSISELAEIHGVSRKTIYKWLDRYQEQGVQGLRNLSRRPHHSPNQVSAEVEAAIVEARQRWRWGPGKLRVKLCGQDSSQQWPAVSTIAAVLKAKGLVVSRRRRARTPVQRPPYAAADAPNAVWCADFKGWFRSGDGTRIDPLTITDSCSRYLLRCQIVERTGYTQTQAVFEAAFREYGLPVVIHTDNGVPFASVAPGGLSRLSMWFVRLGIVPERSRPACPQDNGRHERMHRTLKEAAASPPKADRRAQQQAFNEFRREYNEERPHQALAMQTPEAVYRRSPRPFPGRVPEPEYDTTMKVRRVFKHGQFFFNQHDVFLSKVLYGERIGLLPIDDRYLRIYMAWYPIARLDTRTMKVEKLRREDLAPDA